MQIEKISCPVCGFLQQGTIFKTKDFRFNLSDREFHVIKCQNCVFVFLNPRPAQSESSLFYPKTFYLVEDTFIHKLFGLFYRWVRPINNKAFAKEKSSGRILDIGCGRGDFLLAMQKKGYDVYGVEVSGHSKNFISHTLTKKIYEKNVEECEFPEKFFDVVTMFQSLEHVHNLNIVLQEIKRILKPGGILYLSIPNFRFFEYRLFGPYAYTLDVPRHLYFFTKQSISNLLDKYGFTDKRFRRSLIEEFFITPASFYHGVWYYVQDTFKFRCEIVKRISCLPLVIIGIVAHMLFIREGHILQVVCREDSSCHG